MPEISYDRLREVLDYNPDNGIFRWKVGRQRIKVGAVAGCKNRLGYIKISVDNRLYSAHRLAWLYTNGYFPENHIDHINRVCDDNRISNLREISMSCNLRNSKTQCNNTSGIRGVSWHNQCGKWDANIAVNNKLYHLGLYDNFDEAVCARLAAEQCLDWEGCDSNSSAFQHVQKMIGESK